MNTKTVWVLLRILLGWTFLWAFIDKVFGLGFATSPESAWLAGGSPTTGFLAYATKGPFSTFFQALAGSAMVDWLFMLALVCLGISLIFGIAVRIGSYVGMFLLFLMYIAVLPAAHNPLIDEHIIYIVVLLGILMQDTSASYWKRLPIVQRYPVLQ